MKSSRGFVNRKLFLCFANWRNISASCRFQIFLEFLCRARRLTSARFVIKKYFWLNFSRWKFIFFNVFESKHRRENSGHKIDNIIFKHIFQFHQGFLMKTFFYYFFIHNLKFEIEKYEEVSEIYFKPDCLA